MIFYFLLALVIGFTESEVGKKCQYSSDCSSSSVLGSIEDCIDGVCQCQPGIEVEYNAFTLKPECDKIQYSVKVLSSNCNATSCEPNATCEPIKDKGNKWSNLDKKVCYCNKGFIRVGDSCREANHQSLLESCGGSAPPSGIRSCDLESHSYCSDGKCVCFENFFANTTSRRCEPIKDYLEAFNLTEYRVKPLEYCANNDHCIPGLECKSFRCHCPTPCTYNPTEEICDCGHVSSVRSPPVGPIILGVLLGILIMMFWLSMISKTIEKFDAKMKARFSDTDVSSSPSDNSYALNPVTPTNASSGANGPPTGFVVPSPSNGGRQSPASNDSLPHKTGGDSSGLPPPYSSISPPMNNSSTDLPYPPNPTDSTSTLPYRSNPSTLPYPPSPSAFPYTISPSAPYPTSSASAETESRTAPPAYNPSYP